MKLTRIRIHNFRSIIDANIEAHNFLLLVGANNAGKSNVINALRCFYDDLKWSEDDFPKKGAKDQESWIELSFNLLENEWENLADKYKKIDTDHSLVLKRWLKGEKAKAKQSNIYAIVNGIEEDDLFYGAKQVSTAKCGSIIYIPALTTPTEQMKTTGPSPLRSILNFMLNKVISDSPAYDQLGRAFEKLNSEAKNDNGFLSEIAKSLNNALNHWDVKIDLSVNSISPDDIIKSLIQYAFIDMELGNTAFDLERFGHGFQRSVIYELIRIAPNFKDKKEYNKKEFEPNFTLLLFEEPETFLHPSQQESMAYNLRRLGRETELQVIVTSHSSIFVSKSCDDFGQICRIQKHEGISKIYQLQNEKREELFKSGSDLIDALKHYVEDDTIEQNKKIKVKKLIDNAPNDEIASQYEKFRFQLWLDSDRASMFFADKVILVEGATEKALFNYLLANDWYDLTKERILVIDALGKYNFHRFLKLFETYGIWHGIMFDNDDEKNEHIVINQFIRERKTDFTLADPFEFNKCLENHLGLPIPNRDDQKPLQILKALNDKTITAEQLNQLRVAFCSALNIKADRE